MAAGAVLGQCGYGGGARPRPGRRRACHYPPGRGAGRILVGMDTTQSAQPPAQVVSGTPLAGRVAVVTGASSGIGEATAVRFA